MLNDQIRGKEFKSEFTENFSSTLHKSTSMYIHFDWAGINPNVLSW